MREFCGPYKVARIGSGILLSGGIEGGRDRRTRVPLPIWKKTDQVVVVLTVSLSLSVGVSGVTSCRPFWRRRGHKLRLSWLSDAFLSR